MLLSWNLFVQKLWQNIYYVYIKNQEDQCKNISPCLKRCISPLWNAFKQFVSLLDFPILCAIPNHNIPWDNITFKHVIKHCWSLTALPLWAYFISIVVHKWCLIKTFFKPHDEHILITLVGNMLLSWTLNLCLIPFDCHTSYHTFKYDSLCWWVIPMGIEGK